MWVNSDQQKKGNIIRVNPQQCHFMPTVSTRDKFLIKLDYRETVSCYCSLTGRVMAAHSPPRSGLGAREEGLELFPQYSGFMCPLLLISPAKQLLIPQVPLRSVPGSSGRLTSLSQQEGIVECTVSRRREFSSQTFVWCLSDVMESSAVKKRPNLIFPLAEVTFGKEQWELAQQTPGSFSKTSGPKQEIRDAFGHQLYLNKPP